MIPVLNPSIQMLIADSRQDQISKGRMFYPCKSNLKLKSYGITCTNCESGSLPLLSRHLTASFLSSLGSCRHTQSSKDFMSFTKSGRYQSNSSEIINLFVLDIPTVACK
ncbi:hypothetical protein Peur_050370 [Populus x canadensis]